MDPRSQTDPDKSTPALWRWYPEAPLLTLGGRPMPVAIWPAPPAQRADVESVIGPSDTPPTADRVRDEARLTDFLERAASAGIDLYDGTIAAMRRIHVGERLRVDWSPGSYFDQLATCEAAAAEWERSVESSSTDDPGSLPLRSKMHALCDDPLQDGSGRCAGIGVSTIVRFATDDGPRVWLGRQWKNKPIGGGQWHVIPSGMLEPHDAAETRLSIRDMILREFAEELFGHTADAFDPEDRWWMQTDAVAELIGMIDGGDAAIELTGVSIDLLNLRPEVCVMLRIDRADWRGRRIDRIATNWEFEGDVREVRFDTEGSFAADLGDDLARLVPPAAGALALALGKSGQPSAP